MKNLVMALFAEGSTDDQFLGIIAQRTAEHILNQHSTEIVDVLDPQPVRRRSASKRAEQILHAAQDVHGYHLLLVHADADAPTQDGARSERIEPGVQRVEQAINQGEHVCDTLVPVIPIRMTEAWMLADPDALINIIGTRSSPADLGVSHRPHEVERISDPKSKLQNALNVSRSPRRRRPPKIGALYEPLARMLSLDRLAQVPAYGQFQTDLTQALRELHFIRGEIRTEF